MLIAPRIAIAGLPEEDREVAHHIEGQLYDMGNYVDRFLACLLLIERSGFEETQLIELRRAEKKRVQDNLVGVSFGETYEELKSEINIRRTWKQISERDAITTIWDFSATMYAIRKNLDRCASLNKIVPRTEIEKVLKALSDAFPDRKFARHAALHPADMSKSPKEQKRHATSDKIDLVGLKSEGSGLTLRHVSGNGVVLSTYEGRVVQASIDEQSYKTLRNLLLAFFACFEDASKISMNMFLETRGWAKPLDPAGGGD